MRGSHPYDRNVETPHLALRALVARTVLCVAILGATLATVSAPASAVATDGPAPCSAGPPPYPYHGFCGTYGGQNTYYGSFGPGFPTPLGWALCAFSAGGGGAYPAPGYDYVLSGPPPGADTAYVGPLGYAFSRATADGLWNGRPGAFTADQAAVAAKLLYDVLIWKAPIPVMDPGVSAAYFQLLSWTDSAIGATGAPNISITLVGGGASFTTHATVHISVWLPGSNRGVAGQGVIVSATNATFDGTGGASSTGVTTDATGGATVSITATSVGPVSVTVHAVASVGQPGLDFYRPTRHVLDAQNIVAGPAPATIFESETFVSEQPVPQTGTISISKSGNDMPYYPIAGAIFEILSGTDVVDTLVTNASGMTPRSGPLLVGGYTIHEAVPPPGYESAPDQRVAVVASMNTVAFFTGANGDRIRPATLSLRKVNQVTGLGVAGAVLALRFDPANDGIFSEDLGTCTTGIDGSCVPAGNDGAALLPGTYQVTEVRAPPGFALVPPTTKTIELGPGEVGDVAFADPPLVPQSFVKVATGNVDPSTEVLSGAVIDVRTTTGETVTSCTTDSMGTCATPADLIAGTRYCWIETAAPPGLEGGAHGCFIASDASPPVPIPVTDAGLYVQILARKVSAAQPNNGVPGATFDFYRMDGGAGPTNPTPPSGAATLNGGTWVARATSASTGVATPPLQLPGYAYCVIEHHAPPGYELAPGHRCTGVIIGHPSTPPETVTVVMDDVETITNLSVVKHNALEPGQGVPGATYDLYVQGTPPASTPPPPANAPVFAHLTWFASGTTSATGHLTFTIPVGHAWCVHERATPSDFLLDPALRCTGVITAATPDPVRSIAISERVASITLTGFKFNTASPGVGIPGALYALFVVGSFPPGFSAPTVPPSVVVPSDMELFATGQSDASGHVVFSIPSGFSWCLQELDAPAGYTLDPGLHCTAELTTSSPSSTTTIALPEIATLAFTGTSLPFIPGAALLVAGVIVVVEAQRRRRRRLRHEQGEKISP